MPPSPEPKAGKFVFKEKRFKDVYKSEPKPGPAHYELPPQVQVWKESMIVTYRAACTLLEISRAVILWL